MTSIKSIVTKALLVAAPIAFVENRGRLCQEVTP